MNSLSGVCFLGDFNPRYQYWGDRMSNPMYNQVVTIADAFNMVNKGELTFFHEVVLQYWFLYLPSMSDRFFFQSLQSKVTTGERIDVFTTATGRVHVVVAEEVNKPLRNK